MQGADIIVEASRLSSSKTLLKTKWKIPGSSILPYGPMSAVGLSLTDIMVDGWGQAHCIFGALYAHVDQDKLAVDTLHA